MARKFFTHLKPVYLLFHDILSRNNKFTGQIADDKVATQMRDDEREVQNGGEKMDNPPPYNWINRRFVALARVLSYFLLDVATLRVAVR